jgi:hypothetical protein
MSIAVSAVVKPSRLLLAMSAAICLGSALIGAAIALGMIGEMAPWLRTAIGTVCIVAAADALYRTVRARKTLHIDISGHGQIRLVEHSAGDAAQRAPAELVSLMADSTLWPGLLLLHLQTDDRRRIVLTVLPDSVEEGGFRALAVACRWIAAHNHPLERPPF